jgi:hypothetical protein
MTRVGSGVAGSAYYEDDPTQCQETLRGGIGNRCIDNANSHWPRLSKAFVLREESLQGSQM